MAHVLELQSEAFGLIDVPVLCQELRNLGGGDALDIGTGEGSFLLKLAAASPQLDFLGIERDPDLLELAQSRLRRVALPNVRFEQSTFGSHYRRQHDVVLSRFTLQHVGEPQEFVRSVHATLRPGGRFVCIEPVYDYYDCDPPQAVWREFRARMLATYERWKGHPNIPKQIGPWLWESGFVSVRTAVHLYSPVTIGRDRFQRVVLATAIMMHGDQRDVWDRRFLKQLERWMQSLSADPFMAIAHIVASVPTGG
ncbi:MAG: methyltransferase domain-containing protein [Gemmatimonadales bacterium]|nr:methyltransferase domain-containing protein [Gemmatimonadales bacterium]NIN12004.1 methyltransferase domain-containing protein [Gemmatimonadales bacterium]NIN50535.1 methyltransferase domain-containing protein [Gemmatimonadales bacterium]NIP07999.1 methyltransferase domain-containing protein [Gemmatimonadales bacterium]NIR00601.1 methyltransferase domain-containing protein [Gemmatimonadales bacterium]